MGPLRGDIEKVPKGLSLKEYYARIYEWHRKNKNKIFDKLKNRDKHDPYIKCYLELMEIIPDPEHASKEDIALICREVIAGLMEWAYHEEDDYGVKMAAYAHYILNSFFDGFHGEKTIKYAQNSRLYPEYSLINCLNRYK